MKIENISDKEYRALEAESYSSLKNLLKSPKAFLDAKSKPFTGNSATLLGTAVHHFIQNNAHLVYFKSDEKGKEAKAESEKLQEEFLKANPDGMIISEIYRERIETIYNNCITDPRVKQILDKCEYEIPFNGVDSLVYADNERVNLKGKVDGYNIGFLMDIKTTSQGVTTKEFRETVKNLHYDFQASLYLLLSNSKHRNYYFIVCNTSKPYDVNIFKASKKTLESGDEKIVIALDRYRRYIKNKEVWFEPIEEV